MGIKGITFSARLLQISNVTFVLLHKEEVESFLVLNVLKVLHPLCQGHATALP